MHTQAAPSARPQGMSQPHLSTHASCREKEDETKLEASKQVPAGFRSSSIATATVVPGVFLIIGTVPSSARAKHFSSASRLGCLSDPAREKRMTWRWPCFARWGSLHAGSCVASCCHACRRRPVHVLRARLHGNHAFCGRLGVFNLAWKKIKDVLAK
jgi:hypothetical protein